MTGTLEDMDNLVGQKLVPVTPLGRPKPTYYTTVRLIRQFLRALVPRDRYPVLLELFGKMNAAPLQWDQETLQQEVQRLWLTWPTGEYTL